MTEVQVTGRSRKSPIAGTDLDAYSIRQFCERHGFSVQTFYKLESQMPPTFWVGTRRLISREAAARWRKERERAAKA